jgi:hypothetical protein
MSNDAVGEKGEGGIELVLMYRYSFILIGRSIEICQQSLLRVAKPFIFDIEYYSIMLATCD